MHYVPLNPGCATAVHGCGSTLVIGCACEAGGQACLVWLTWKGACYSCCFLVAAACVFELVCIF